jgi:hypothetical protein
VTGPCQVRQASFALASAGSPPSRGRRAARACSVPRARERAKNRLITRREVIRTAVRRPCCPGGRRSDHTKGGPRCEPPPTRRGACQRETPLAHAARVTAGRRRRAGPACRADARTIGVPARAEHPRRPLVSPTRTERGPGALPARCIGPLESRLSTAIRMPVGFCWSGEEGTGPTARVLWPHVGTRATGRDSTAPSHTYNRAVTVSRGRRSPPDSSMEAGPVTRRRQSG